MKKTIKRTDELGEILEFAWGLAILCGTAYLVFWKDASPWWFLLAVLLVQVSFPYEKVEIED